MVCHFSTALWDQSSCNIVSVHGSNVRHQILTRVPTHGLSATQPVIKHWFYFDFLQVILPLQTRGLYKAHSRRVIHWGLQSEGGLAFHATDTSTKTRGFFRQRKISQANIIWSEKFYIHHYNVWTGNISEGSNFTGLVKRQAQMLSLGCILTDNFNV